MVGSQLLPPLLLLALVLLLKLDGAFSLLLLTTLQVRTGKEEDRLLKSWSGAYRPATQLASGPLPQTVLVCQSPSSQELFLLPEARWVVMRTGGVLTHPLPTPALRLPLLRPSMT